MHQTGANCVALQRDVTNPASVDAFLDQVEATLDPVDS